MYILDLVVALVFVLALIAVSHLKKYVTEEDKDSYNHVAVGLGILATVCLTQIYSRLGLFSQVPFLADPLFFRIVFWIGIITGLTFLTSGVSTWVPLSRSYRRYNKDRIQKLELIRKIEQLLRIDSRLPIVLDKILKYIAETYQLARGGAYLYSFARGQVICVGSTDSVSKNDTALRSISFNTDSINRGVTDSSLSGNLIFALPANLATADMSIPIVTGDRTVGFFLLWASDAAPLLDDDRISLKIIADIIAHQVCRDFLQAKQDFHDELNEWTQSLNARMDYQRSPQHCLTVLATNLKGKVDFDYLSLSVIKNDLSAVRLSLGENKGVLTETGVDFNAAPSLTRTVYIQSLPIYLDHLNTRTAPALDDAIVRNGYQSMAILPVKHGANVEAVVTIARTQPHGFAARERRFIQAMLPAAGGIAISQTRYLENKAKEHRGYVLNSFLSKVVEMENTPDIFESAVDIIATELKPSVVRISSVGHKGQFLESLALKSTEPVGMVTPARGSMIMSLMPYHQLVLETGRPMMVNQQSTERRMTDIETHQVFGTAIKSVLMVPVRIGPSTVGIISLAQTRQWIEHQFKQEDIQFVSAIASALAAALKLKQKKNESRIEKSKVIGRFNPKVYADARTRTRIKSSLSGILGSVEILKGREKLSESDLTRCLAIIDKSAQRINQCVLETKK